MATTILAGTGDSLYMIQGDRIEHRLPGRAISALEPADDGSWWAILDRRVVMRSSDLEEWHEIVPFLEVDAACLLADDDALWIGTTDAQLFHFDGRALIRVESFEQVEGRSEWWTPWGGPPETRSLAGSTERAVYANVHVGGIPRSTDGGMTWQPTIEVDADVHQVVVHPDRPDLVLAATGRGLAISRDSGNSWEFRADGLHGRYMRAIAISGTTLFGSASTGSSDRARSAVYRIDISQPDFFERCEGGLPESITGNIDTYCLAASGSTVAFGAPDGHVYRSDDRGETWHEAASGLPEVRSVEIRE